MNKKIIEYQIQRIEHLLEVTKNEIDDLKKIVAFGEETKK